MLVQKPVEDETLSRTKVCDELLSREREYLNLMDKTSNTLRFLKYEEGFKVVSELLDLVNHYDFLKAKEK